MKNETIDKLKNYGYITSTDDSQGIADKVGIGGGSPVSPTDPDAHKNDYFTIEICDPVARGDEIAFDVEVFNNGETSIIIDQALIDVLDSYYKNIQYRVNGEEKWNNLKLHLGDGVIGQEIAAGDSFDLSWGVNEAVLWLGDKLEFKHVGELNLDSLPDYQTISTNAHIFANKTIDVYGNIMSLLHGDNFKDRTTLTQPFCLTELFSRNNNLRNAGGLVLPATTLTEGCYLDMFSNCTNLITAPTLPATTLAPNCYAEMFIGCVKLCVNPYHLPATTLAPNCYTGMFALADGTNYFKVDAEKVVDPVIPEAPVWAEVVSMMSVGTSYVLEINDFELYREVPESQLGDDSAVHIIFVKRTDQYIDFYGDQKKKYVAATLNKILTLYPDLKEIWGEKGDSDLSAYHIRLNGNDIDSVSYEEESDSLSQHLIFIAEDEVADAKYNLSWGSDDRTNFIIYEVSKLSSVVFKTTGDKEVPWAQMNITDELYEKWNTLLMSYDGHRTTDSEELKKFDVSFEDLDEPLHSAGIIEDEEDPSNSYMYFAASQGDTEARAELYLSTKTVQVTVQSVG